MTTSTQANARLISVAKRYLKQIDTLAVKLDGKISAGVQALIVEAKVQGMTGDPIVQMIESYYLKACALRGVISESSIKSYKTSIRMALALDCEFRVGLFNDKAAQEAYAAKRGVAGKGLAHAKRKAHSPGAATGAKVTQVAADAPSAKPAIQGRQVTLSAPPSADLAMIAPMLADIVSQPARLALFCDWYKATFTK